MTAPGPEDELDLDRLRARLRAMSDAALLHWGRSAAYMASPAASWGEPPRECFIIQLREARAEWRRRLARPEADHSVARFDLR